MRAVVMREFGPPEVLQPAEMTGRRVVTSLNGTGGYAQRAAVAAAVAAAGRQLVEVPDGVALRDAVALLAEK